MLATIQDNRQQIIDLASTYGVNFIGLFGSHARGEADLDSDIDLLIDYKKPLGLFKFAKLQKELSEVLSNKVDLVSRKGVSKYLKPYIENDLRVLYEEN